jgi:RND family efflux transporter MFP subunit
MKRRLATLLGLVTWLAACSQGPRETQAAAPRAAPVQVKVTEASFVNWPLSYEATGTVRARTSASISSKLMAAVREVRVQIGVSVKEGQLLIVLDSRDLDASVRRTEAARDEVKGAFPEAESAVAAAKATLDLAQVTFNRMQDLFNKKSITNQEFDEASARLKAAQASFDMAQAKRAQLDAKLAQAEQEVRSASVTRGYAEIAAPFAGVVVGKQAEPGNMAIPGAPLLTIEREGAYRLEASVEESRLSSIRVGQKVPVKLETRNVTGTVSEIVPEVDAASRTGTVKIDLPAAPDLRSGLFGRALFGTGMRKVLTIPASSVIYRGQVQSVLVIDNGTARTRLVALGSENSDRVEVLSGLNAGERVVVSSPQSVGDGSPVETLP